MQIPQQQPQQMMRPPQQMQRQQPAQAPMQPGQQQSPQAQMQKLVHAKEQLDTMLASEKISKQEFEKIYRMKMQVENAIKQLQQMGGQQGGLLQSLQSPQQMTPQRPQQRPQQQRPMPQQRPAQMGNLPNTGFVQNVMQQLGQNGMIGGMR